MKRVIALVALLVAASACAQETSNTNTQTNANANATPSATASPAVAQVTVADATAREQQVWAALKSKNWDAFAAFLADDQVYVGEDGIYGKAETVEAVKKLDISELTATDWKIVNLDKDAYVITCTSTMKGSYDGKPVPGNPVRESTAWINRGGKWLAVYHQESDVIEPPPMPASSPGATNSNSNQSASASASPAASHSPSPGGATSPVDIEKHVWEALKHKDYAAFASHLADDQLEVEPSGVYTKAQTIEGVKRVDFSKATLSDFKETKLDADASLVTYTVKATGQGWNPAGERHSTIWMNRGGKWLAVFHQGTYIKK